ncbi:MAG TPA: [LysW]-lysine hydrolase [Candidatus Acidoferrum sp.]|nr:[LysW]-lysine hydrolase [Candidatus Acidoferrum sp.]
MISVVRAETEPVTETGVEMLEEMVSIPSVSTQERELGQWLVTRLRGMGFAARRDEVGNVIAFWGSGPREVLLLGHMDTVPGFIPVRREGRQLFGRGAVDAKGPLAAAITAVARQPAGAACRFTIIGAVEEEGSSRGARHLVSRKPPDQLVILEPSGWDAITLGYKGSLKVRYRLSKPMGHGAGPNESAADQAIAFIRKVQDHATAQGDGLGNFERLDARILRFHADHDGFKDTAAMTVGFRLPPNFDVPALQKQLETWAEIAELRFEYADAAVRAEKNTPVVRAFLKGIRDTGGTPRFKMKTGTSDMNILAPVWGCPTLAYGPGDSKLDHTPDEAMDLENFARGVDVLTSALSHLAR